MKESKYKIEFGENTYVIHCPECKTSFDATSKVNEWVKELINTTRILEKIRKIMKENRKK